ncbi:MAG: ribonuclease H-like domain-containing protein [bacterium]|nr:MAG: ribonuclease H-like domain-containing protein [bacterium]
MDIREKLQFIEQIQKPRALEKEKIGPQTRIEEVIDGEFIETDFGVAFVRTKEYNIDDRHGTVQLGQIDEVSPYFLQLAGKDENLLQIDLRRSFFFDTETTGLAGGSGTYIFLTGLGYFEKDKFIIKQFFLRDFPDEPATLHAIHLLLKQFESIVSFNGKSFDWPLLQTRFTYHRIKSELIDPPHLDLLHAARRIWKHRLTDCSLGNLEYEVINVCRHNDIPSYMIPHLYFEYLRNKDAKPLKKIFYHNEMDILSLVSLTIMLNHIHKQPLEELNHHIDLRTLAKHYENTNQWHRAISLYLSIIENETNQEEKTDLSIRLSYCYKRLGQWENAVALWEKLLTNGNLRFEPYEELAKYYEHRVRDYTRAEQIVMKALANLEIMEQIQFNNSRSDCRKNLTHRLKRIQRKMEK